MASLDRFIQLMNQLRDVLPPLKALLFEVFWLALAVIEMTRFLRWRAEVLSRGRSHGKRNRTVAKALMGSSE